MYYPYLRGKQNELITVRDNAELLSRSKFTPIIEPVKEPMGGLHRALDAVVTARGQAIVVVNPRHGEFCGDGNDGISRFIEEHYPQSPHIIVGILLEKDTTLENVKDLFGRHAAHQKAFIHAGFSNGKGLADLFSGEMQNVQNIFIDGHNGKLYQKHFKNSHRVLIRDGFKRRNNREYPEVEFFSDLHLTYDDEGMDGFGDFLIAGDEYRESGGPAYAVAIHATCINSQKDSEMLVHHFVSIRQDTPTDPAGKFSEALNKLIEEANKPDTNIIASNAIAEYRDLHQRKHFPGLGYVKKLSMQHHIETLADFFDNLED